MVQIYRKVNEDINNDIRKNERNHRNWPQNMEILKNDKTINNAQIKLLLFI